MSDASDRVAEARARTLQLAARRQARKAQLEAELARRRGEWTELDSLGQSDDVVALGRDLEARIQAVTAELATVESELKDALREADSLRKLVGQAQVGEAQAIARSVIDPDPILRSPEDQALDNVRSHIAGLEAQVRLGEEVDAGRSDPPTEPTPPPAPGGRPKKTL